MLLTNPVVVAVFIMIILCLFRLPVLLSLIISAIAGGLISGMNLETLMKTFIGGMGGNANTALSYILLGSLAACITKTGAADALARLIGNAVRENKIVLLAIIVLVSMASGTIIPVHIAFIPILIPPLLGMMNRMKFDRRMAAIGFGFGLKAPYITIPVAYGAIFHGIIVDAMNLAGTPQEISMGMIWRATWPAGIAMIAGLGIGILMYSKGRQYNLEQAVLADDKPVEGQVSTFHMVVSALAGLTALVIQLMTNSLPLGALCGIILMIVTRTIRWNQIQEMLDDGIKLMGYIAFVMLIATGFAAVINATGGVDQLVTVASGALGGSKLVGSFVMAMIGLLVTMGIGTSFGTVPILAAIYTPLGLKLGLSIPAIILLIAVAAALGDAGSPASDTTLGPTAGLNADGQHDHIWDTCVPQFICYDIPLIIVGTLAPILFP